MIFLKKSWMRYKNMELAKLDGFSDDNYKDMILSLQQARPWSM